MCNIGDYVICYEDNYPNEYNIFLSNNIGRIICINAGYDYIVVSYDNNKIESNFKYLYKYDDLNVYCRNINNNDIIYSSNNITDLELIISVNKYNL